MEYQKNEFHVFTDSGRIIRPVFFLKTDSNGDKYNELIQDDVVLLKIGKKLSMVTFMGRLKI